MSPLAHTLLALAFAALFNSAVCQKECNSTEIGKIPFSIRPPLPVEFSFTVPGTWKTIVEIENNCPHLPGSLFNLVKENVSVCNNSGLKLKIVPPKEDVFSSIEVLCFRTIFGMDVPCFLEKFTMQVQVTQYCDVNWPFFPPNGNDEKISLSKSYDLTEETE